MDSIVEGVSATKELKDESSRDEVEGNSFALRLFLFFMRKEHDQ
ncbi:hypothetical protein [Ammoniphilus sp. CFH 90114]|nr:hypothetical protein [Ammoniphilus sp. CFH 90114]